MSATWRTWVTTEGQHAGTGKSYLLKAIIAELTARYAGKPQALAVTAMTAMAAAPL